MPEQHRMRMDTQPAGPSPDRMEVIRKRPDFLAANRGKRYVTPDFILLVHRRCNEGAAARELKRYGVTVTKKIGSAVKRNRMKRRFRALLMATLPEHGIAGADHILIGRRQASEPPYADLRAQLEKGLRHLAGKV